MNGSNGKMALTKRQSEIYDYLRECILSRGFGPTVREIGDHFEIKSPNGVMCHLKALEKKGLISRQSNMSRAIGLAQPSSRGASVSFIGTAVSGRPIQAAISSDDQVDFDYLFGGTEKGCIAVRGTAFESLGISDGDSIIVQRNANGKEGALVAALDDRHSVTFCRIEGEGRQPVPAIEGAYPAPMRQILGIVIAVVRSFDAIEE